MTAKRITGLAGLLFVAAATFAPIGKLSLAYSGLGKPWGAEPLWWVLAGAIVLYVVAVERLPLSSIGFRRPGVWDVVLGAVGGIAIIVGIGALLAVVYQALHLKPDQSMAASLMAQPLFYRIAIVTRAAVVEEIVFRGYGMERLKSLTGSWTIAAVLTWAAFTYAHLAGMGLVNLLIPAAAGGAITLLYLWRRNLWTTIIAHWLVDGASLILVPMLSAAHH